MRILVAVLLFALSGCALLGKSEPLVPRYFTPEYQTDGPATVRRPDLVLRLGRVEGWPHLREAMVARNAARELFYSDERHWTERPEVYLRSALARALFEERGVTESVAAHATVLEVELTAFEELQSEPHQARLQALLVLRDERLALLEETFTAEAPVAKSGASDHGRAVADALSLALRDAVTRMADRVLARLSEQKAASR